MNNFGKFSLSPSPFSSLFSLSLSSFFFLLSPFSSLSLFFPLSLSLFSLSLFFFSLSLSDSLPFSFPLSLPLFPSLSLFYYEQK